MHPLVRDTKKTDIYRDVQKNIPEENMTNLKLFFCLLGPTCPNERGGAPAYRAHCMPAALIDGWTRTQKLDVMKKLAIAKTIKLQQS